MHSVRIGFTDTAERAKIRVSGPKTGIHVVRWGVWRRFVLMHALLCALTLTLVLPCGNVVAQVPRYNLIELGLPDGAESSYGLSVSDDGDVVGWYGSLYDGLYHAFRWRDGAITEIRPLPGDEFAQAARLSPNGTAAGGSWWLDCTDFPCLREYSAFVEVNGVVSDLNDLVNGGTNWMLAAANDASDAGHVVGWGRMEPDGPPLAFVFDNGIVDGVGAVPDLETSVATGVNELGQVVGNVVIEPPSGSYGRAFISIDGVMTELPTLGGDFSWATDINDAGIVVGGAENQRFWSNATRWDNGVVTEITGVPQASSYATAINNLGEIAGYIYDAEDLPRPFVWRDGELVDVRSHITNDGGEVLDLREAYDINDAGQIVGLVRTRIHPWHLTFVGILLNPAQIDLSAPFPGVAGETNTVNILDAPPGSRVYVAYGSEDGYTRPRGCGLGLNIDAPRAAGSVVVDAQGNGQFEGFVPGAAKGQRVIIQAFTLDPCTVSQPLPTTFQ